MLKYKFGYQVSKCYPFRDTTDDNHKLDEQTKAFIALQQAISSKPNEILNLNDDGLLFRDKQNQGWLIELL